MEVFLAIFPLFDYACSLYVGTQMISSHLDNEHNFCDWGLGIWW